MRAVERPPALSLLLPFVLVSFAANSLITRYVVRDNLLDAGLLTAVRFVAGAAALVLLSIARRQRVRVGRANLRPALWLGIYAVCISYGYRHIGAAAGTFIFYAAVLLTLVVDDRRRGTRLPARRLVGAGVALAGIAVLASDSVGTVTPLGVGLLVATGVAWGLYTAAGRAAVDPSTATTGHFTLLAGVLLLPAGAGLATGLHVTAEGMGWAVVMGAGNDRLRLRRLVRLPARPHRGASGFGAAGDPGADHRGCGRPARRAAVCPADRRRRTGGRGHVPGARGTRVALTGRPVRPSGSRAPSPLVLLLETSAAVRSKRWGR